MRRRPGLLVACAAVLGACTPAVRSASFVESPPRPDAHPIPLYSTKLPECEYEEVGLVSVKRRGFTTMEQMVEALRKRAREMGGDAVVAVAQGRSVEGGSVTGNVVSINDQDVLTGTVIRFPDPGCTK